jgi:predicted MPP superfamily phosphohydrolase
MKIIHLSDLHICSNDLRPKLEEFLKSVTQLAKFSQIPQLDFEFTDSSRLDRIVQAVKELDPDVVCITGDVTTFGDAKSFDEAAKFISRLREKERGARKIVVTPGNHDVLCSQLKLMVDNISSALDKIINKVPWPYKFGVRWFIKRKWEKLKEIVEAILNTEGVVVNLKDPLGHFKKFTEDAQCSLGRDPIGDANGCHIWCVPFNSVSMDPLWVNIGESRLKEFQTFRDTLKANTEKNNSMVIALLHHNPISAPDIVEPHLVHAYNSFPGASSYVKEMQDAGVDLILYGHQHKCSFCQIDFLPSKPGHLYLIGASSSTKMNNGGFNLIVIQDRFHGSIQSFSFNAAGRPIEDQKEPEQLVFESKRCDDLLTLTTRLEIRLFSRSESGIWETELNEGIRPNAKDLFIVRPRGQYLIRSELLGKLKAVLDSRINEKVRILVSDPDLFSIIENLPAEERERISQMWGDKFDWEDQSRGARTAIGRLKDYKKSLEQGLSTKLEIRGAHTLMPVGAVIRTGENNRKLVFLRLLPVGLDKLSRREIHLEMRHENAISDFYIKYLEGLWEKGKPM